MDKEGCRFVKCPDLLDISVGYALIPVATQYNVDCDKCVFNNNEMCNLIACQKDDRDDDTNVYFIVEPLKEVV